MKKFNAVIAVSFATLATLALVAQAAAGSPSPSRYDTSADLNGFAVETASTSKSASKSEIKLAFKKAIQSGKSSVSIPVNPGTLTKLQIKVAVREGARVYTRVNVDSMGVGKYRAKWNAPNGNTMRLNVLENGKGH